MGYFACRAAPMGPVEPGVVDATFFNFHPDRVRRAIPDAWRIVDPAVVVGVRAEAAAAALRRLLTDHPAERLAQRSLPVLHEAIESASGAGKPLFSANRDLGVPSDPVAALWQAATTLREHRGDGHVALLVGAGLDGCAAHVLFAATEGLSADLYQQSRGWSDDDWQGALERLANQGHLAPDGKPTDQGRALRAEIERRTDELAIEPYVRIADEDFRQLLAALATAAEEVVASREILFPNPMGLPRWPDAAES